MRGVTEKKKTGWSLFIVDDEKCLRGRQSTQLLANS
jgi:hypothetical protein